METEERLKILRDSGCNLVQGYYFSKPLPPEEFEKLIERDIAAEGERTVIWRKDCRLYCCCRCLGSAAQADGIGKRRRTGLKWYVKLFMIR